MEIPQNLIDSVEEKRIDKRIFHDRVKILHEHLLTTSIPATILCSSVLLVALFPITDKAVIISWFISVLAVSALRICFYRIYKSEPNNDEFNLKLFVVGSTIAALTWTVAGTILMPWHDLYHLGLTLVIIAGITAGGSQTLQASRTANTLFMILAILPLTLWLMYQNQHAYLVLSIAVFGYLCFMLELSSRGYKQLIDSIRLSHVNEFLVKQLSGMNDDLLNEISERKRTQEKLDYLATHDALTKIPNRLSFNLIFNKSLARAQRHSQELTVLFIDVDFFKEINDNYGHDIGDMILFKVAHRLKRHLRANDTIARIGGDEFIILLEDVSGNDFLDKFSKRISRLFSKPIKVKEYCLPITLSIGVSFFPNDGENTDILLKKADIALYRAKDMGRNRIEYYQELIHRNS